MSGQAQSEVKHARRLRLGMAVVLAVFYYGIFVLGYHHQSDGAFWIGLLVLPFSIGMGVQIIWDPRVERTFGEVFAANIIVLTILVIGLMALAIETLICVVMALPIFVPLQLGGIATARRALAESWAVHRNKIQVSLLGLPVVLAMLGLNPTLPTRFEIQTNVIEIAASREDVWAQIVEFPTVQSEERLWTLSHNVLGAPAPERSRLQNGVRIAEWTHDVTYEEVVTSISAPREMHWDIRFAPGFSMPGFDQHINPASSQMALLDGGYTLTAQPDGGARVELHTRYRLQTGFNSYVALWGSQFLGDNHASILHVLKLRSEAL